MTSLLTADTHFTDNLRDADRWNLFPWMREQVKKHRITQVFMLGDLTDAKDRHSAKLVNRFVSEIGELSRMCPVILLKGNHDCVDENNPFFGFLSEMDNTTFFSKPAWIDEFMLLPHTKNWQEEWSDWPNTTVGCKYILTHATFDGAKAENGQELRGIPPSFFKLFRGQVWSGDIHVPQKVSRNIEYVGAPYRVHFGDTFTPRVVLLKRGEVIDLHPPVKSRELALIRALRDLEKCNWVMGTQVKTRVLLKRSEYPEWPALKREIQKLCGDRGWELCGLELKALKSAKTDPDDDIEVSSIVPEDQLNEYAKINKLPKELRTVGTNLLKEAQ